MTASGRRASAVFIVCDRIESYLGYVRTRRPDLFGAEVRGASAAALSEDEVAKAASVDVAGARAWIAQADPLVVDLRSPFAYAALHIAGSVNIVDELFEELVRTAFRSAGAGRCCWPVRSASGRRGTRRCGPARPSGRSQPRRRDRRLAGRRRRTGQGVRADGSVPGSPAAVARGVAGPFPIVTAHPALAYLDSAATSQKPDAVLDAVRTYLIGSNANAGRGTYPWANATTAMVERVRGRVKAFLGDPAPERSRVDFTSGTSEGLRAVALDWLPGVLADGDEIVVPFGDHQANTLPWLEARDLLARRGVRVAVREMPYQEGSRDYDTAELARQVTPRTRFVAATHVHHVYGGDMNVRRVRRAVGPDAVICLDAAQSVGHVPVRLGELDVDFVVFSGHKALALPGTGAVWSRGLRGPALAPGGWAGTLNTWAS